MIKLRIKKKQVQTKKKEHREAEMKWEIFNRAIFVQVGN